MADYVRHPGQPEMIWDIRERDDERLTKNSDKGDICVEVMAIAEGIKNTGEGIGVGSEKDGISGGRVAVEELAVRLHSSCLCIRDERWHATQ